jgi:predicted RNase H-like HicB family nuclease
MVKIGDHLKRLKTRPAARCKKGRYQMTSHTFTAVVHKEEDLYVAECPEVGTASQGPTFEEAISNLKEATELYLEEFPKPMIERTIMTTFSNKRT